MTSQTTSLTMMRFSARLARHARPLRGASLLGSSAVLAAFMACSGPDGSSATDAVPAFSGAASSADPASGGAADEGPGGAATEPSASGPDESAAPAEEATETGGMQPGSSSEQTPEPSTDELMGGESSEGGGAEMTEPEVTEPEVTEPEVEEPPVDPGDLPPLTVWLAGDSTVANGNTPCPVGWGKVFAPYFDERVTIVNRAVGGRSVNTWLYEVLGTMDASGECEHRLDGQGNPLLQDRWQGMLDQMQPGDYLLIQFGINDGDPSCDRHVGIAAFRESYGMMAEAAKQRGVQPVFITPVSMIRCSGTTPVGSRGAFVPTTIEAGADFDVPVIDLHQLSVELYAQLDFCPVAGGDVSASTGGAVGAFFCDDHTHFDASGAVVIAGLVAEALRTQQLPLSAYLR